jgi:hypothetical protein
MNELMFCFCSDEATDSHLDGPLVSMQYTSLMKGTAEKALSNIMEIAEAAKVKNGRENVCGVLIYDEASQQVQQVLEGPSDAVLRMHETIVNDARHSFIVPAEIGEISFRSFYGWNITLALTRARGRVGREAAEDAAEKAHAQVMPGDEMQAPDWPDIDEQWDDMRGPPSEPDSNEESEDNCEEGSMVGVRVGAGHSGLIAVPEGLPVQ